MKRDSLPLKLQFFADPGDPSNPPANNPPSNNPPVNNPPSNQPPAFDYEKLASLINGKQSATEDSVLKGYFKQQGLSKEEAEQAISAFKQQKAANEPNVEELQAQSAQAQQMALNAQIENKALLMHQELGVDLSTIPYLMKLADISAVVTDGKIDDEKLKEALNKVLDDVPQLKGNKEQAQQGFRQVGAGQQTTQGNPVGENKPVVPTKRWNRFNN